MAKTIWALGVPAEYRKALEASMPELQFHFIGLNRALADRKETILASEEPCIATWGGNVTGDFQQFVAETKIPTARLGPSTLFVQAKSRSDELLPYGYYIEPLRNTDPHVLSLTAEKWLATGASLPDEEQVLAQAADVIAHLRSKAVGRYNFGKRQAQPLTSSDRRSVLIVADDVNSFVKLDDKRYVAYLSMVKAAKKRYPGWDRFFVLNGDHEIPETVAQQIRHEVTGVLLTRYTSAMLVEHDVVMVNNSWAGFDALLHDKPLVCFGQTVFGTQDTMTPGLDRVVAATFLSSVRYVDPVNNLSIELKEAIDQIAHKIGQLAVPREEAPACWSGPLVALPVLAATPVGAKPVGVLQTAPVTYPPDDIARRFVPPPWLAPEEAIADADGIAPILYLSNDLFFAPPSIRALAKRWMPLCLDEANADVASAFNADALAWAQPEFLSRLLVGRIKRSGAKAAVIFDLGNRATRLFSRSCGVAGVRRIYIPAAPFGLNQNRWPYLAKNMEALTTLADVALAWDDGHKDCMLDAAFPEERVIDVVMEEEAPDHELVNDTIVISLTKPWPADLKREPTRLREFVGALQGIADTFDCRFCFYFGKNALHGVGDKVFSIFHASASADYEIEGAELVMLADRIKTAKVVISDSFEIFASALNQRKQGFFLNHDVHANEFAHDVVASVVQLQFELSRWLDAPVSHRAPSRPEHALALEPVLDVLAGLIEVSDLMTDGDSLPGLQKMQEAAGLEPLWPPVASAMGARRVVINRISSSMSDQVMDDMLPYLKDLLGVKGWSQTTKNSRLEELLDVDLFVQWGIRVNTTKQAIDRFARRLNKDVLTLEDGFIRSIAIGLSGEPTLSIVMDDMTAFYDATQPSRIESMLASELELSAEQRTRARMAIDLIAHHKVSKYNFAPYVRFDIGVPDKKVILIIDQREGDQSITSGLASPETFKLMVDKALTMTDDHHVIIKTHPDANIGGKGSAVGSARLESLRSNPAVTILTQDVNPYSLIDVVDKVFVVTSGVGLEALLAGKEVWCFGMPFYAGWGLTKDHLSIDRRQRRRTLEDVFYFFYIMLSRYYDPVLEKACTVEQLTRYIAATRPWRMPASSMLPTLLGPARALASPLSRLGLMNHRSLWGAHFPQWKHDYVGRIFSAHAVEFFPSNDSSVVHFAAAIQKSESPIFLVWGNNTLPGLAAFSRKWQVPIVRMDDGFLPPAALGARGNLPYAYCLDRQGIYFDASKPSDLETILATYDFAAHPDLLGEAAEMMALVVQHGISKSNIAPARHVDDLYGPKTRKRILVISQAKDDPAVLFGDAVRTLTNNDLVRLARQENPDAQIIYQVDSDSFGDPDSFGSNPEEVAGICEISSENVSLNDTFEGVDHVYTNTSAAGFEALLRGIAVTTLGAPFYAGWGLTDTRVATPRRGRKLDVTELFAGTYLLYAKYADPLTGRTSTLRQTLDALIAEQKELGGELEFDVDMRSEINGSNWHDVEPDGRWAGPELESTLEIPALGPGKYDLQIDVADEMGGDTLESMQLVFNGSNVGFTREGTVFPCVLRAKLMVSAKRTDPTWVLKFRFEKIFTPQELMPNVPDTRKLAIRVKGLRLTRTSL